jgi:hypothetical protein
MDEAEVVILLNAYGLSMDRTNSLLRRAGMLRNFQHPRRLRERSLRFNTSDGLKLPLVERSSDALMRNREKCEKNSKLHFY